MSIKSSNRITHLESRVSARIRRRRVAALLLASCLGLGPWGEAQESSSASGSVEAPRVAEASWSGPDTSDGFDWVELTSGEWLKGDFKSLYDKKLEFDSDKLDLLILDWDDVRRVVTERTHTVRSENRLEFSGPLYIDEKQVKVMGPDGETQVFERRELLSVVEGAPREINYWSFKLGAGLTIQKGNTEQADLNVSARIRRETSGNRFQFEYLGLVTTIDDMETANNHRVNSSFDVFVSRRIFVRPIFVEYYRDRFLNLDHRATAGAGVGYHLIDTSRTEWDTYAGIAYQYTRFSSVMPGEDAEAKSPAFVAGTQYDVELTNWMDFLVLYNMNVLNRQSGTYTHHAKAGLEIELTDIMDLDLSLVWDRTQNPQERDDGTFPDRDDFRFILGVSLDF